MRRIGAIFWVAVSAAKVALTGVVAPMMVLLIEPPVIVAAGVVSEVVEIEVMPVMLPPVNAGTAVKAGTAVPAVLFMKTERAA